MHIVCSRKKCPNLKFLVYTLSIHLYIIWTGYILSTINRQEIILSKEIYMYIISLNSQYLIHSGLSSVGISRFTRFTGSLRKFKLSNVWSNLGIPRNILRSLRNFNRGRSISKGIASHIVPVTPAITNPVTYGILRV